MKRQQEPLTRVGICCGCNKDGMALYKVPELYRYRCAECYQRETGSRPWQAPPEGMTLEQVEQFNRELQIAKDCGGRRR